MVTIITALAIFDRYLLAFLDKTGDHKNVSIAISNCIELENKIRQTVSLISKTPYVGVGVAVVITVTQWSQYCARTARTSLL